jgi:hypothetical protein
MPMHLAQMNVATALHDLDDPHMADFMMRLDDVNALAESSPGFVWRLQSDSGNATDIQVTGNPRLIVNMSVWESVEALFDFAYRSDHRDVMVKRRSWFKKPDGPYQVLWWVEPHRLPTLEDGLERLEILRTQGPTPRAFTFKSVFRPQQEGSDDMKPEPYCVGWS